MPKDPRVTAYIKAARPFARPILKHLRTVVHTACPQAEERMKWGFPHFDHRGKMMCSMAAFTHHAVFGFWYASKLTDPHRMLEKTGRNTAMGQFGRITGIRDLPKKSILIEYIREAARLNEREATTKRSSHKSRKTVTVPRAPASFTAALQKNSRARAAFETFPPGQKRDYIQWITEAKTPETQNRRIRTAVEWIAQGKYRNWKYMKKR